MSFEPDSLGRLLLRRAAAQPDDEGLVFPGTRLTFLQLERRAMELARALVGIGLDPGERVVTIKLPSYNLDQGSHNERWSIILKRYNPCT